MPTKSPATTEPLPTPKKQPAQSAPEPTLSREAVLDIFRRWGYLQASLDPLGQYLPPEPFPTPAPDGPDAQEARRYYCGPIGAEFMHIPSPERRAWIQERLEKDITGNTAAANGLLEQKRILSDLIRADLFEQVIQQRYLGTKRFSLEGLTVLIPFLDQLFTTAAENGVTRSIFAMSHRGRLNVMVNTVGRQSKEIFSKFEDVNPETTMGGGDVKYHMGATGDFTTAHGKTVSLHLASNPSHLEAADPVIMGRTRARQDRIDARIDAHQDNEPNGTPGTKHILPMIIHGDAAFAGQGIWAETLNLATIDGFSVGGTIQVIVNNLLGFTANPEESNSSRFASDLAKRLPIPIFHVNAEDPEAVVRIAALAADYRNTFNSDVVIDLIGYRRHGHSEVDDPTVTQPRRYALIKDHPPLYKLYAQKLGTDIAAEVTATQNELLEAQRNAAKSDAKDEKAAKKAGGFSAFVMKRLHSLPSYWDKYAGGPLSPDDNPITGLDAAEIAALTQKLTSAPEGFHVHPKVAKLMEQRVEMGNNKRPIDYGFAELLAYAALLKSGTPVRLSGQDTQRGTFNQRHSVLIDTETEVRWSPLSHIAPDGKQGRWQVYNTMLSEAACLGYEYGYARDYPEALVLWEAQFGDFANGAQIIIDQFLAAGEAKWGLLSGVVLLLPHGYEGQGPEHSSARIERYLQLAAQENIQVTQPSTAAQYFHLLRRQSMRKWRKPLIVFTPKSMLRHPDASSTVPDLAAERFLPVVPDTSITPGGPESKVQRVLVTSGKIGHNLRVERARRKIDDTAILFVDELYPWPEAELTAAIAQHPNAHEIVWVQEEPANMGPLNYVMPLLRKLAGNRAVLSVKRTASASPATGSPKAHELEEKTLIDLAFGL